MADHWRERLAWGARDVLRGRGVELTRLRGSTTHGGHLHNLFAREGVDLVLDVGARHGEFGSFLRRNGYSGRMVSFEPVAGNVDHLRERCSGDPLWTFEPVALGSEDGLAEINVMELSMFSSFRTPSHEAVERFGDTIAVTSVESVRVRRLDNLWESIAGGCRAAFLKLDTQGWDLEVLAGAVGCLDSIVALQTEMSVSAIYEGTPSWIESVQTINGYGFQPSGFFPVLTEDNGAMVEMDCVAVRRA